MSDIAPDAATFYTRVQQWSAVPYELVRLPVAAVHLVPHDKLRRWLTAEINRLHTDDDAIADTADVDLELVEFICGLLEHPDFCTSELLAQELHEFIDDRAVVSRLCEEGELID